MFYVSLFQYTGSGPNWKKDGPEYKNCENAWYWNLLYINNFAAEKENKVENIDFMNVSNFLKSYTI